MASSDNPCVDRLSLVMIAQQVPLFFQLLGHGFNVSIQTGCSVKELLCNQLGIHEDYLAQRIQSIFLNGKVVDDVTTAVVQENAVIALSGAMPGLVGAILRGGESYAPMRSQISHQKNSTSTRVQEGKKITLKLWNLVVKELGPVFLQRGILIQRNELQRFFKLHEDALKTGCQEAVIMGTSVAVEQLTGQIVKSDPVFLQVNALK